MKCKYCGTEVNELDLCCQSCGEKVEKAVMVKTEVEENIKNEYNGENTSDYQKENAEKSDSKLKKNKTLFFAGGLVLIILTALLLNLFSAQNRFMSQLNSDNYDKAKTIYEESKDKDKEEIEKIVDKYCEKNWIKYNSAKMDYEEAKASISSAESIISSNNWMTKLTKLHTSKEAFEKAEKYTENENWENAKIEYKKVIEEDENFSKAEEAILSCEKEISFAAYNQAQKYMEETKWAEALVEYEKVTEITPDVYKKAEEEKKECIEKFKISINTQLNELFVAEKYEEGLKLIKIAEKYILDDEALTLHKENFTARKEETDRIKEQNKYNTGITYDQLSRNPDEYIGEYVKFYGKVLQVQSGSGITVYRIGTSGYYYSDDVIYAIKQDKNTSNRIIEDDYVTIKGMSMGLHTYKTVMGNEITIPSVVVDYIER